MNQLLTILIIIILLTFIYLYVVKSGRKDRKKRALWQECRRLLRLPTKLADETIERQIKSLKERHPGQTEEWYLEKIIYDLKRDRK
ncbi:MAG: hypothetical protein KBI07_02865 [Candidatus Atribacteria bacterium]|nr:hypothetical protein [Candidatus Atribacteria bacterium]